MVDEMTARDVANPVICQPMTRTHTHCAAASRGVIVPMSGATSIVEIELFEDVARVDEAKQDLQEIKLFISRSTRRLVHVLRPWSNFDGSPA
jgi:hypothetical protein